MDVVGGAVTGILEKGLHELGVDLHPAPLCGGNHHLENVLAFHLRRSALSLDQALEIMTDAETLLRGREYSLPSEPIMRLVAGSDCSAYDCEFVALARELGVSLVTSDEKVLGAFGETAVSPVRFAG